MHPQSPTRINYWRNCAEGVWWPCYIWSDIWFQATSPWLLRSNFALFPEQLLNGLVSWGRHGKYSMIDCFLGDALGVLSCQFWSTVLPFGALLTIHTLDYWTSGQWCQFFDWGRVWVWPHIVALWQYYVCCTRSGVTRYTLFVVLFLCRMCRWGYTRRSHIGSLMRLLAAEPRSIAGLLFPCQYLCGTILVTPCSMVWDWRVSRAGPMHFYWPCYSLTFYLLLFSLSFLSFFGLVLWGWGLRTDRVLIALSQPCIANLFW